MPFEKITTPEGWNEDVLRMGGGFLQSWEWGSFQEAAGKQVVRLRELSGARLQAIRMPLPLGQHYWYCPRGPVFADEAGEVLEAVPSDDVLGDGLFFRFDPAETVVHESLKKAADVQPPRTLVLDTTRDPDEIMAGMHRKWRYNIRLAERKGLRVIPGPGTKDGIGVFWDLLQETTERGGFRGHPRAHYARMLKALSGDPSVRNDQARARLLFAEHDGRVLAASLLIYFGDTVTYLHGASSRDRRELMAPHLLHWKAIEEAHHWGYAKYDLWGVAPEGDEDHPWAGVSRFKRGFGGEEIEYPGTHDLILKPNWYRLYTIAQRLRGR